MAGGTARTPAEALEDLRQEWRDNPDARRDIARDADAVKILELIMRPDNRTTT